MLHTLWCWLFGHKVMGKAFTGNTLDTYANGQLISQVQLYRWERLTRCIRCGKEA